MNHESDARVETIAKAMREIVDEEYVSTNIFERLSNILDPFPYEAERHQIPYVVVMPETTREVSEIMKYANREKVPVFVRGSGTQLAGSSRPHTSGILLNVQRMNKLEIMEDYGYFECGPGCIVAKVDEAVSKLGYFLPVVPGSRIVARMGGLASNNSSGHVIDTSIGKLGDYIMGVEVVLPTGEIMETGTKGLRRIAGTDLTKFFVGGDGLLGVITKIRMRLVPGYERAYGVAIFDNLEALARGVQRMYWEKRPAPLYMEFMEEEAANIGFEIKKMPLPGGSIIFFVSIGYTKEEAERKLELLLESFKKENPVDARIVYDMDEWHRLEGAREVLGSFLMQKSGQQWKSAEIISNLKDLVECIKDAKNFNRGLPIIGQLPLYLYGHIGALSLHPGILIPRDWDNEKQKAAYKEIFQREAELNLKYGGCGGEWGQFSKRTEFFKKRYGEIGYNFILSIKRTVDPNNILNPGIIEGYR